MIYTTNTINKYNNTYHNTIKMKPVNVKSSMYIHSRKEINNKDPKFKISIPDLFIKCNQIFKMHSSIYQVAVSHFFLS